MNQASIALFTWTTIICGFALSACSPSQLNESPTVEATSTPSVTATPDFPSVTFQISSEGILEDGRMVSWSQRFEPALELVTIDTTVLIYSARDYGTTTDITGFSPTRLEISQSLQDTYYLLGVSIAIVNNGTEDIDKHEIIRKLSLEGAELAGFCDGMNNTCFDSSFLLMNGAPIPPFDRDGNGLPIINVFFVVSKGLTEAVMRLSLP